MGLTISQTDITVMKLTAELINGASGSLRDAVFVQIREAKTVIVVKLRRQNTID